MSGRKKVFLSILTVLVLMTLGVVGYVGKIYFDIRATVNESYEASERIETELDYLAGDPFSILLLGTDEGDLEREEHGRTDTMIVATVNPKKELTTLVSLPRDTYTEIIGQGFHDKINHAYAFGGISTSIATVENLLDIPIDYYAQIDLKGMKELVDLVGGVEVNNSFSFHYEGVDFPIGKLQLDGEDARKYSRMRYEDPDGDYGRQNRQRQILTGFLDQARSVNTLANYKEMLDVIGENTQTNISWETSQMLFRHYRTALNHVNSEQLTGVGFTGDGVTGEHGISYQMIAEEELTRIQNELKNQLK
ncbi:MULTISPECIES: LCP family protein [unclassified Enterococcus]|uniref:LCP family glycopolymer transferase n=1 Tax=unclassified Enterococcus TaxID=2608891 RepID=UPI001A9C008E|nr:LCP family protein [Enterococcus sp. DIV1271a]MBO1298673.1 LCP family protein [Enterococcus sp. DIV1271a]